MMLLSRAGVKKINRKLILVLIQERTLLLVSGHIESSAFSLSLVSCSFSLAFSLVLLPFLLPLSPSGSRLPSFLLWVVTRLSGKCTQNKVARSAVTVRICMFMRSCKNLHTCKLPLAGSRSPLVKYARGSHLGFRSTSQTRSSALRMPRYVTFTLLPDLGITQRVFWVCYFVWAECSRQRRRPRTCLRTHIDHGRCGRFQMLRDPPAVNTALALHLQRKRCCNKWFLLLALDEHPLRGEVSRQQGPNGGCAHP